MAGSAYAADFTGLQSMKVSEVKAASGRALLSETGEIKAVPAKGHNEAPAITQVEAPDYICQDDGGGFAIRAAGRSSKI
jgi:hypothetical protein